MHALGGINKNLKEELISDYRSADISNEDLLILEYTEKITSRPAEIKKTDIDTLLDFGFSQAAIHDIVQVAAYFNYVNRLADSLGIELEE